MNVNLTGNKIRLVNTIVSDVSSIINFETSNDQFVHSYPKEKHLSLLKDSDCLHLSIRRLDDNDLVGHMILFGIDSVHKVLEFRRLAINEKGFGYGRDAVQLLKKLCFEKLKFHRLWFDVYDDNERAIGLYESEGFVQEALLRENIKSENGYRSQRIYSMLEDEYN
ncbi:MAG: GNAT family protein [Ignavibacteria bacterium]|jgi:RimJ/RimL family protein N-acetyltransferase